MPSKYWTSEVEEYATVEEVIEFLVRRAAAARDAGGRGAPSMRLSAADLLKRWSWYGMPSIPKPTEEEMRAAMVVAVTNPDLAVDWVLVSPRAHHFSDPKNSPSGDDEPRVTLGRRLQALEDFEK